MSDIWNESWKDYTNYLFALDGSGNILGTFFSKGEFKFTTSNQITGNDIMYLKTKDGNDQEYDFNSNSNTDTDLTQIKFLFYTNNKNKYRTNNLKYENNIIYASFTPIYDIAISRKTNLFLFVTY